MNFFWLHSVHGGHVLHILLLLNPLCSNITWTIALPNRHTVTRPHITRIASTGLPDSGRPLMVVCDSTSKKYTSGYFRGKLLVDFGVSMFLETLAIVRSERPTNQRPLALRRCFLTANYNVSAERAIYNQRKSQIQPQRFLESVSGALGIDAC